ncbi:calcium permeable stress-gated cation channel [Entomortierella parvispora]|uniref:Calcium permeable stress-gated cation channel n=1 Tax=Entomortierella parvispora TaxID=205924 RepID=A0A9P3HE73_9FUNG|nr:calcium permeable stress-gated cation channel [Entomortierella parvispora]
MSQHQAYQQATSTLIEGALVISLLTTLIALTLFSYVRTRRESIFASRRFFIKTDHQADSLPVTFWGWMDGLLFLESRLEKVTASQKTQSTAFVPDTSTTAGSTAPPNVHRQSLWARFMKPPRSSKPASKVPVDKEASERAVIQGKEEEVQSGDTRKERQDTAAATAATTPSSTSPPMSSIFSSAVNAATISSESTSGRQALIAKTGLDHYLLIRFLKMLFSFSVTIGGFSILVLVPLYSFGQSGEDPSRSLPQGQKPPRRIESLQIGNVTDSARLWAAVFVTSIVPVWCWYELMTYLKLRQEFLFRSSTRSSSRVVLLQDLPPSLRSVQSLIRLFSDSPGGGVEHVYLIRDTRALERAVKQRQNCLDRLEKAEVLYMDAIARASALVASTTLLGRSTSSIGRMIYGVQSFLGGRTRMTESSLSHNGNEKAKMVAITSVETKGENRKGSGKLNQHSDEDDYVGPLKLYQLEDVPQLSLTDLSKSALCAPSSTTTIPAEEGQESPTSIGVCTAVSGLSTLKWFQKPRRPHHFIGIPLLGKRQDSIRYYRGELCRLNKTIARLSEEQRKAVAADQELQLQMQNELQREYTQRRQSRQRNDPQQTCPPTIASLSAQGADQLPDTERTGEATTLAPLPSAFLLMRTRAGARSIISGAAASEQIASHLRILGITPRDIDWRVLGQGDRSRLGKVFGRLVVIAIGAVLLVGCGLVVVATAQFGDDKLEPGITVSVRWILSPLLLTGLMLAASWILNGPLSWRKSTLQSSRKHDSERTMGTTIPPGLPPNNTRLPTSSWANDNYAEHAHDEKASLFEANFAPAPTLTPRQAFQLRQPPFFHLQNLYPHLVLLFTVSLTLMPLSPLLFLLWVFVLAILNLSYRYLILQVVTTKNQSGGLHYRQAIGLLMFPTLACPPFVLALFLIIRQAWAQAGIMIVVLLAVLGARVVVGRQFEKREKKMLSQVETFHLQPKVRLDTRDGTSKTMATGLQPPRNGTHSPVLKKAPTAATNAATVTSNSTTIVGLCQLRCETSGATSLTSLPHSPLAASPMDLESGYTPNGANLSSSANGEGQIRGDMTEADELYLSPVRRRMKRIMQRPTTIIGQVRHSLVASIISQGAASSADGSSSPRPKSVPIFDLERYEKEILGISGSHHRRSHKGEHDFSQHDGDTTMVESLQIRRGRHGDGEQMSTSTPMEKVALDIFHHPKVSDQLARSHTTTLTTRSLAQYGQDLFGSDTQSFFSPSYNGNGIAPASVIRSKEEEVDEEKEAKYREIVMALRRASSVASRKGSTLDSRRMQAAGPSSTLEAVTESRLIAGPYARRSPMPGASSNMHHRVSLPNLLDTYGAASPPPHSRSSARHLQNPYLQQAFHSNLSTPSTSSISTHLRCSGGAPSLPMLLIHRESAVAAKETSRIRNLYLNPVLQEARARVIVWLPSQTEVSFMGGPNASVSSHGSSARADWGHCRYHAALRVVGATSGNVQLGVAGAGASDRLFSAHKSQEGTDEKQEDQDSPPQQRTNTAQSISYPCTCRVYQELLKYVADAVALADQEIRDLRTMGLTVWLDSRHVVWGTEKEQDGRLGDRVMVSTGPACGGISNGIRGQSLPQQQIGDGLLSWLEPENPDSGRHHSTHLGTGAVGIIGGSIGVIMKRPIGAYGRLVGDGEEDEIPRGWHGM